MGGATDSFLEGVPLFNFKVFLNRHLSLSKQKKCVYDLFTYLFIRQPGKTTVLVNQGGIRRKGLRKSVGPFSQSFRRKGRGMEDVGL